MRSRIPIPLQAAAAVAVVLILLLIGCRAPGSGNSSGAAVTPAATNGTSDAALADRLEKLPALPPDVAATLDPRTNFTKIASSHPAPVKVTGRAPLAPCCGSKEQKSLKVKVPLTKCAPLRDFIMAPLSDLIMAREAGGGTGTPGGGTGALGTAPGIRAYRLNAVSRADPWNTIVCMTSDGPWDATFEEDRNCNNYQPQDSLIVSGWGGLQGYYWNGGVANHPPGIQLVSCRDIGLFRFPCGGLSGCDCQSSPCPADQPCPCNLSW